MWYGMQRLRICQCGPRGARLRKSGELQQNVQVMLLHALTKQNRADDVPRKSGQIKGLGQKNQWKTAAFRTEKWTTGRCVRKSILKKCRVWDQRGIVPL
jgi:hypothetical protein